MAEMILSEDSTAEKIIPYLNRLKADLQAKQADAQRINAFQGLFKVTTSPIYNLL